jgi:hypothetical protein
MSSNRKSDSRAGKVSCLLGVIIVLAAGFLPLINSHLSPAGQLVGNDVIGVPIFLGGFGLLLLATGIFFLTENKNTSDMNRLNTYARRFSIIGSGTSFLGSVLLVLSLTVLSGNNFYVVASAIMCFVGLAMTGAGYVVIPKLKFLLGGEDCSARLREVSLLRGGVLLHYTYEDKEGTEQNDISASSTDREDITLLRTLKEIPLTVRENGASIRESELQKMLDGARPKIKASNKNTSPEKGLLCNRCPFCKGTITFDRGMNGVCADCKTTFVRFTDNKRPSNGKCTYCGGKTENGDDDNATCFVCGTVFKRDS